jgi:hypothetical protein
MDQLQDSLPKGMQTRGRVDRAGEYGHREFTDCSRSRPPQAVIGPPFTAGSVFIYGLQFPSADPSGLASTTV